MAYALISMFLLTYIQYTMKLTVAQYAVDVYKRQILAKILSITSVTVIKAPTRV